MSLMAGKADGKVEGGIKAVVDPPLGVLKLRGVF